MTTTHPNTPTKTTIAPPNAKDWLVLGLLIFCGGTSFAGIRLGVETAPPAIVGCGRMWIATLVLFIYMKATGREMIPLRSDGKISALWQFAAAIGLIGYAVPMVLFPFAQQSVSSMLAGIYMAFMPLVTVFLAATFADEPLTRRKLIGFAAGTIGVLILIGPEALRGVFSENLIAQLALVGATTCYAVSSVVMRRTPPAPARSFAVAFMLCASVFTTPGAIAAAGAIPDISAQSWLAILYLGVIPTGATAIMIVHLIRGPGAGFMAMANYVTPGVAIGFGILLFGEILRWRYGFGLTAILIGLGIAQPETVRNAWNWLKRIKS